MKNKLVIKFRDQNSILPKKIKRLLSFVSLFPFPTLWNELKNLVMNEKL